MTSEEGPNLHNLIDVTYKTMTISVISVEAWAHKFSGDDHQSPLQLPTRILIVAVKNKKNRKRVRMFCLLFLCTKQQPLVYYHLKKVRNMMLAETKREE